METVRRHSRKREAIRDALLRAEDHPSAEELYARLKPLYPELSLGTVYRNLALFLETGEAACVATVAGQERFDGRTHPHAHFICRACGAVLDVDMQLPEELLRGKLPGRVREYALTFYGVCDHCQSDSK